MDDYMFWGIKESLCPCIINDCQGFEGTVSEKRIYCPKHFKDAVQRLTTTGCILKHLGVCKDIRTKILMRTWRFAKLCGNPKCTVEITGNSYCKEHADCKYDKCWNPRGSNKKYCSRHSLFEY